MKTHHVSALLLLILVVVLAGCGASAEQRLYSARAALTSAQDTLGVWHDAGQLSDEDIVALDAPVQVARAAITSAKLYVHEEGESFEKWMRVLTDALDQLESYLLRNAQKRIE